MSSMQVWGTIFAHVLWLVSTVSLTHPSPYEGWKDAEYCATLERIQTYAIPSVFNTSRVAHTKSNLRLIQVQVVARHGARAPYYNVFCWDKESSPLVEQEWQCGPTAVTSQDFAHGHYERLYKKSYDQGRNILPGTCVIGGLLPLGRAQHHANGKLLRQAYMGPGGPMHLFSTSHLLQPEDVFLRSDDEERTMGSGQALVDGMFPPQDHDVKPLKELLTWHTADAAMDIMFPNAKICPRLNYISQLSTASAGFSDYISSTTTREIQTKVEQIVGKISWETLLECLMIARCNDIPLPANFSETLFDQAIDQVEHRNYIQMTFGDAVYSKTSMAPLFRMILDRMQHMMSFPTSEKLAIYMAHDSTLMPMLAAMLGSKWDGKWTAYASMIGFELYQYQEEDHDKFAVRVLYRGQPLQLPGCEDELCDYPVFEQLLNFATNAPSCTMPAPEESLVEESNEPTTSGPVSSSCIFPVVLGAVAAVGLLVIRSVSHRDFRVLEQQSLLSRDNRSI